MRPSSRFVIRNDLAEPAFLNIEPEGVLYSLGSGEEVSVIDRFATQPVTVNWSMSDAGSLVISLWPGDGDVRVEKEGVDLLDLASAEIRTSSAMPALLKTIPHRRHKLEPKPSRREVIARLTRASTAFLLHGERVSRRFRSKINEFPEDPETQQGDHPKEYLDHRYRTAKAADSAGEVTRGRFRTNMIAPASQSAGRTAVEAVILQEKRKHKGEGEAKNHQRRMIVDRETNDPEHDEAQEDQPADRQKRVRDDPQIKMRIHPQAIDPRGQGGIEMGIAHVGRIRSGHGTVVSLGSRKVSRTSPKVEAAESGDEAIAEIGQGCFHSFNEQRIVRRVFGDDHDANFAQGQLAGQPLIARFGGGDGLERGIEPIVVREVRSTVQPIILRRVREVTLPTCADPIII